MTKKPIHKKRTKLFTASSRSIGRLAARRKNTKSAVYQQTNSAKSSNRQIPLGRSSKISSMSLHQMPFPFALHVAVNVSSVSHRSPFRYPGGKTWLIPHVYRWLMSRNRKPSVFVEPFAGGAITGLTVAFEQLADRVVLVELDADVSAVWHVVLNGKGAALADRIEAFDLTLPSVKSVLSAENKKIEDRAFATLLRNRVQHGGILAAGASLMKDGEKGKGIKSRWYPQTLARRIRDIIGVKDRIESHTDDAFAFIKKYATDESAVFFVDPPYTVAGRRLYRHSEIDHAALFKAMSKVAGDFLMTYDNTEEVRKWASEYGFDVEQVAMKSRQHTEKNELLIGRNLKWARG